MNSFVSVIRNKRADEIRVGNTAQGRDGVWRTVKVVKSKAKAVGTCIMIGFAGGRTDSFDSYEMIKTK